MLESPSSSGGSNSDLSSTANIATIKRYARPSQRNRSLGRRKSGGDRLDRSSIYVNEGEKNQVAASRSVPIVDHRDAGSSILVNENSHARLIYLHGCCGSEAFQLLNDRWAAAMNEYNNPSIDLAGSVTYSVGIIRLFSGKAGNVFRQFSVGGLGALQASSSVDVPIGQCCIF